MGRAARLGAQASVSLASDARVALAGPAVGADPPMPSTRSPTTRIPRPPRRPPPFARRLDFNEHGPRLARP